MIENCGIAIFVFGNKETENIASGVMDEYELSKEHGLVYLPIGYTGGASKEIYDKITRDLTDGLIMNAIEQANKQSAVTLLRSAVIPRSLSLLSIRPSVILVAYTGTLICVSMYGMPPM